MSDAQPPLKRHEYILKELLKTEQDFANNMAFLAGLKPVIKKALQEGLNEEATEETLTHQKAVLAYLEAIEATHKSSLKVGALFDVATDIAKKIEKGEISQAEIKAHQQKLEKNLDLHIKNLTHAGFLFKKYNIEVYFDPNKTPLSLNKIIHQIINQKQNDHETSYNNINILAIMPVQRIPRYQLLATDLEKQLLAENIPNLKAEQVALTSQKAATAGAALNQQVEQAARENRIIILKKVTETKTPISHQVLKQAELELKELIESGVSLTQELQNEGLSLGNLIAKIRQGKKSEPIQLQGPKEKQIGDTAANVMSGYIKAGFPIQFDDSVHAAKLWQETLQKGMPDDKMAPIIIDLPPELLKNTILLRQTVKTAAMLQEKGFDVQTTPRFKKALESNQEKSYGFFNILAKMRQFNFKTAAQQFVNTVPTFKPVPPPRPTVALPLLLASNAAGIEIKKQKQQEADSQAVMTSPKKKFLVSPGAVLSKRKKNASHSPEKHQKLREKQSSATSVVNRPRND